MRPAERTVRRSRQLLELHDAVLSGLAKPGWLVGKSLLDHRWDIQTEEGHGRRRNLRTIIFETPVEPGPLLLTEPECENDLLTAKLYVYLSLPPHGTSSAVTAEFNYRSLMWLIRWRRDRGIRRTSSLTREWFNEFCESLRRSVGAVGLIDWNLRVERYLQTRRAAGTAFPTYAKGRRQLLDCVKVLAELGVSDTSQISRGAWKRILRSAAGDGIKLLPRQASLLDVASDTDMPDEGSRSRISTLLNVWENLWQFREHLAHDSLEFAPFPPGVAPYSVSFGAPPKRTPTIPSEQACFLIDRALRWVLEYSDDLKRFADILSSAYSRVTSSSTVPWNAGAQAFAAAVERFAPERIGPGAPWPLYHSYTTNRTQGLNGRTPLKDAIDMLVAACAIVIATFSARRHEEIESLRTGCIIWKDDQPELETWISKTLRRLDHIPVPVSVTRAVKVLSWISAEARKKSATSWLFQTRGFHPARHENGRRSQQFDFFYLIQKFADYVTVPPLPNGDKWAFTPHQFRRFFAVVYYHRFRYPSLTALSDFLRHFDPDMTRRYITEAATGGMLRIAEEQRIAAKSRRLRHNMRSANVAYDDFNQVAHEFKVERFTRVAEGKERMSGFGGVLLTSELKEAISRIKGTIAISDATSDGSTLSAVVEAFAAQRKLEPNPLGHSFCKCGSSPQDLRVAKCLVVRAAREPGSESKFTGPDDAFATDTACSACPHNVQLVENEPYWRKRIEIETRQAACGLSRQARLMAEERLKAMKKHVARCFDGDADKEVG